MKHKTELCDPLPEKIYKRLHLSYFTFKAILFAFVFFIAFQTSGKIILRDRANSEGTSENFAGHTYCGTFFISRDKENSFVSDKAYEQYMDSANNAGDGIINNVIMIVCILSLVILLFMAFRNADKKKLFANKTSRLLIIAGLIFALGNVISEINTFISSRDRSMYKGIMADAGYYCQLYAVLIMPVIIFSLGLIIRQHELKILNKNTDKNSTALKITAVSSLIISSLFILYRFAVRSYELVRVMYGNKTTVRIPFYSDMLDLPMYLADSQASYMELILLRFIKDLPVFAVSFISVLFFVKIIFSAADGLINTPANRRKILIIMIMLVCSSLIFNLLGLVEVNMLNDHFKGIYNTATYTIGIRSGCEPALYAVVLWFFSNFIQAIPEK